MKKAFMNSLDNDEKMAATEYGIEVHHENGEVIELTSVNYAFQDVFEYISEYYENKNDTAINKVIIKVNK